MALFPLHTFITGLFSLSLCFCTTIPRRRRELQAKSRFTFCKPNPRATDDGTCDDEFEFGCLAKGGDESDVAWPPLWKKAGSPAIRSAGPSPFHDEDSFLYPTSQAQTIAGCRQEMLDMVRVMPETDYELSFKDLVESPRIHETPVKGMETLKDKIEKEKDRKGKMKEGKRRMSWRESMETVSLLLKIYFPSSLIGRRKSVAASGICAKVSPKPMPVAGRIASGEERRSSSSSSSNSSSRGRKIIGFHSFFRANKNKARKD